MAKSPYKSETDRDSRDLSSPLKQLKIDILTAICQIGKKWQSKISHSYIT